MSWKWWSSLIQRSSLWLNFLRRKVSSFFSLHCMWVCVCVLCMTFLLSDGIKSIKQHNWCLLNSFLYQVQIPQTFVTLGQNFVIFFLKHDLLVYGWDFRWIHFCWASQKKIIILWRRGEKVLVFTLCLPWCTVYGVLILWLNMRAPVWCITYFWWAWSSETLLYSARYLRA